MASIKEEVMTVKDDCQYVRALDANGNSIRISKEDLAKVLGELLPLAKPGQDGLLSGEGFMRIKGRDSAPDDANKAVNGIYYISRRTTNYPVESTTGVLVSFSPDGYLAGQICFSIWPEAVYVRSKGDSWGQWLKIQ